MSCGLQVKVTNFNAPDKVKLEGLVTETEKWFNEIDRHQELIIARSTAINAIDDFCYWIEESEIAEFLERKCSSELRASAKNMSQKCEQLRQKANPELDDLKANANDMLDMKKSLKQHISLHEKLDGLISTIEKGIGNGKILDSDTVLIHDAILRARSTALSNPQLAIDELESKWNGAVTAKVKTDEEASKKQLQADAISSLVQGTNDTLHAESSQCEKSVSETGGSEAVNTTMESETLAHEEL